MVATVPDGQAGWDVTTWSRLVNPVDRGLRVWPILWCRRVDWELPRVSSVDFDAIFRTLPGSTSTRLSTFGHIDGRKGEAGVPHYLATRGVTPLHHDPAYPRYSVQLSIYNHGLALAGWVEGTMQVIPPGWLYCLDTHSPHQVVRSGKVLGVRQKLQAAIDYTIEPLGDDDTIDGALRAYCGKHHPTRGPR